jgi:hypothetical protein
MAFPLLHHRREKCSFPASRAHPSRIPPFPIRFSFVATSLTFMMVSPEEVFVKLLTKFNLVLVLVFGLGMFLISHYAYNFLMSDARQQVLEQA